MQDFLEILILGNRVQQWLLAFLFVLGSLGAGKILSSFLSYGFRKLQFPYEELIAGTFQHPLILLMTTGGAALGCGFLLLNPAAKLWVDRLLEILSITLIAWGISAVLDAFIMHYVKTRDPASKKEMDLQLLLKKLGKTLVWVIAAGLILKVLGYNVSALMAGLGLGGAALALASKDTLANCFGSITVFVDRPFRMNDRIKIAGYEGFITEMGFRTSRLRTLENRTVIIPNSLFAANPIENITAGLTIKNTQTLSIKTSLGLQKITQGMALLREIGAGVEGTCETPGVGLASIGGNACQITFTFYIAQSADYMDTVNRVNLEILRRFEEAEITLV